MNEKYQQEEKFYNCSVIITDVLFTHMCRTEGLYKCRICVFRLN
jgi:hypothetical protein